MPENVAAGPAGIDILRGGMLLRRGLLTVDPVAPGVFTALGNGNGPPAAFVLRVRADGSREETVAFACPAAGKCAPAPIRFSDTTAVVLTLYGAGLRAAAPATTRAGG